MYNIYYNPKVFTPKKSLKWIMAVDPTNSVTKLQLRTRTPYANRKEALANNFSGSVFFYENGRLYLAELVPKWVYKPCNIMQHEGSTNCWEICYACKLDDFKPYIECLGGNCDNLESVAKYNAELGVYSVEVYYNGRIR